MSDKLSLNVPFGLSKPESSFNTPKVAAADYFRFQTNGFNVTLPSSEKLHTEGMVGSGNEYAVSGNSVVDYVGHGGFSIGDRLNTTLFALIAKSFAAGSVTSVEVPTSTGVYDHTIKMMISNDSIQLPSRSFAFEAGGFDYIMAGAVANTLNIQYTKGQAPTFQSDWVTSGKLDTMSAQTPALVLPAILPQKYVGHASQVQCNMNDGSLFDFAALGILHSFGFQASNNVVTNDRRAGDPLFVSGDPDKGAVAGRLERSSRTCQPTATVFVDSTKRAYTDALNGTEVQDLTFKASGGIIASTYRNEVEFTIPRAIIETVGIQDDSGKLVLPLTFKPMFLTSEDGIWKIRVRNSSATLT